MIDGLYDRLIDERLSAERTALLDANQASVATTGERCTAGGSSSEVGQR